MWLVIGLLVAYILVAWISLHQAALPADPCRPDRRACYHAMVRPGQELTMQLWLYQPHNDTKKQPQSSSSSLYKWTAVETCRFHVTLPPTGTLPQMVTTSATSNDTTTRKKNDTCTVPIPEAARHRSAGQAQPLRARFVFTRDKLILAVAPFELTRVVERRPSAFWSSHSASSSSSSSTQRNLVQGPLAKQNQSVHAVNPDPSLPMYIPYYKYLRSAVRLRFVAEDRSYGPRLERADGLQLRAHNATHYAPYIYVDDLSLQRGSKGELAPPGSNKPPVELQIKLSSLSPFLDALNQQAHQGFRLLETLLPVEEELDEIRWFLSDERLYRFLLTQVISYLHMWFDFLAFRDEIRFYRGRRNWSGVSASTVVTRLVCSIIIFLYLLDGGGTSWVVLLSMFSSCAIEAWKVWKLLQPTWKSTFPFVAVRELRTEQEQETAEYDRIAVRRLAMVLYPIVIAWSFYALKQYEYKSWYSWLISNLANAVYTFGFISLCPQLYVNYRLKSVAHLPWKVFLYKIFNTFVDDVFAFIIDMPWKHRIMTLRDDVVFLIFLVQFYIYRVDKSRTNEFGYSYEEAEATSASDSSSADDSSTLRNEPSTKLKEE